MSQRKVIVGLDQLQFLSGIDEDLPDIDLNAFFYACMIQAGVEEFEVLNLDGADSDLNDLDLLNLPDSDFLRQRTSNLPAAEWTETLASVYLSLKGFYREDYPTGSNVSNLLLFLADLMLAVKRKTSLVWLNPIPNIYDLQNNMPPELFIIIRNLMLAIEHEAASLPIPKSFISVEHFRRFQDVIGSDLFGHYSANHRQFENGRILKLDAVRSVETSGRALIARNKGLLTAQRLAINTIPISTRIIDTVFGKLPGTLAEVFGKYLSEWLADDRRIAIYCFNPIVGNLLWTRFLQSRKNEAL